ncbi:SDR family NAD(P)-dependent oxidoreductase [Ruegeria sp. HKCCD6228]|uniref:SDR family NAD(P)-dependent oxidoreductase n=1 Tax=Ruegeria atlantica TaxID=81569 RepID=A0AA90YS29_9RHOB|nr:MULTISPECIES: SDR family NAD(P)-dependent oxidoreductase [Ruegeria]NOD97232.1 SDR family NAD(P)-dependent oxidoreductase [Ruegeria sp. HKCCD6228]NOE17807.1 SDR family NAD(P)-dependent oxidoreductase [Ruegeria atlantica]
MTSQRIALVTGANRGIGKEVSRQLARDHGMKVLMGARDLSKGQAAADEIGYGAEALELDVSSPDSVAAAFFLMVEPSYGRLDVLVNNAGVDYDTDQQVHLADLDRVRRAFDTNLFGPWDTTIAAVPLLQRGTDARIVNVSSGAGSLNSMSAGTPGYGVSKAALNALTLKTAAALKPQGILVNAVCPGWVATDLGGGGRPISEGAKGVVWAATLPKGGPTGGFFRDGVAIDW